MCAVHVWSKHVPLPSPSPPESVISHLLFHFTIQRYGKSEDIFLSSIGYHFYKFPPPTHSTICLDIKPSVLYVFICARLFLSFQEQELWSDYKWRRKLDYSSSLALPFLFYENEHERKKGERNWQSICIMSIADVYIGLIYIYTFYLVDKGDPSWSHLPDWT